VKPKSTATPLPGFLEPMKAKLVESRPVAGSWFYEIKFDGYIAPLLSVAGGIQTG
jgi:ATP-dependent DNA ligase